MTERITAKRLVAGDVLVHALGYPESTLSGKVDDVRPSPGGGCVLVTFEAGELMLYPTDVVEVGRSTASFPERDKAQAIGHDMREARQSSIEPPRGLYATCKTCGRSAWAEPDLQGGHGTAPTHGCKP